MAKKLDAITFHAKLGSQGERVQRVRRIAHAAPSWRQTSSRNGSEAGVRADADTNPSA